MYYSAMLKPPTMNEMRILIINGPNLNLLGMRRPEIYGRETFGETLAKLRKRFGKVTLEYFQSNSEGEIINRIQQAAFCPDNEDNGKTNATEGEENRVTGIVINPGAYAHYSHAIADAIEACPLPVAEVHISNIFAREEFRTQTVTGRCADAVIAGCGRNGYALAIEHILDMHLSEE